ncbi:MlaA family lipoprotein [Thermomonas sp.]|jgi:phospholipid-binding lipoprotein MlaA|uniref:MlaA family lipoprotein n=1 Tax=Thermomonas sp. TaxID=1971895 RepID=UPI00257CE03E|nr:MlaA family lipoprotein [Thermomonas sp.]
MNRLLAGATLGLLLATAGCATQPAPRAVAELPADAVVEAPVAQAPGTDAAPPAAPAEPTAVIDPATPAAAAAPAAATAAVAPPAAAAADEDFAAIYGEDAGANGGDSFAALDPWEPMNRRVHAFNSAIDQGFMRPLARGYVRVVPAPIRAGVSNFFDNLGAPLAFGNLLLQGRPRESVETLGRFLVNTVAGLGGLFDPATKALKMHRHGADFGRTLARWGWRESRYLELPFLGPRTLRDAVGAVGDTSMAPMTYVEHDRTRVSLEALWLVDVRSALLSLDELRDAAPDEYVLTRDAWLARRRYLVEADRSARDEGNESLPAYLMEAEPAPPRP